MGKLLKNFEYLDDDDIICCDLQVSCGEDVRNHYSTELLNKQEFIIHEEMINPLCDQIIILKQWLISQITVIKRHLMINLIFF